MVQSMLSIASFWELVCPTILIEPYQACLPYRGRGWCTIKHLSGQWSCLACFVNVTVVTSCCSNWRISKWKRCILIVRTCRRTVYNSQLLTMQHFPPKNSIKKPHRPAKAFKPRRSIFGLWYLESGYSHALIPHIPPVGKLGIQVLPPKEGNMFCPLSFRFARMPQLHQYGVCYPQDTNGGSSWDFPGWVCGQDSPQTGSDIRIAHKIYPHTRVD